MKMLKRFAFIAVIFILAAFRCSDDEQLAISVEVYPGTIAADGVSQAKFTVFEGNADVMYLRKNIRNDMERIFSNIWKNCFWK